MRTWITLIATGLLLTAFGFGGEALPPNMGGYEGPGTIVLGVGGQPSPTGGGQQLILADNGAVVCEDTGFAAGTASGKGGVCIPFDDLSGDSVLVTDDQEGTDVAFQVCVDANGDSVCSAGNDGLVPSNCTDIVIFSHESFSGNNHNPLYIDPLLRAHYDSCPTPGFAGYIVIICAGVDSGGGSPHTHEATAGTVAGTFTGGTPSGDFCGAPTAEKAYAVL